MNYIDRAKKSIGAVTVSSGASAAQQNAFALNNQINGMGTYNGGTYTQMLNDTMDKIANNKANYNLASDQALTKYAQDYSALSKLGVAGAEANTGTFAGGYGTDYASAVSDQAYNSYVTGLDMLATAQQIGQRQNSNLIDSMGNISNLANFNYNNWQDKMSALQNARELEQSAYNKLYGVDLDAYTDKQSAMANLLQYYGNLGLDKAQLQQKLAEAKQDRSVSKTKSKSKSGRGGSGTGVNLGITDGKNQKLAFTNGDANLMIKQWAKDHKGYSDKELESAITELYKKGYVLTSNEKQELFNKYKNTVSSGAAKKGTYKPPKPANTKFASVISGLSLLK